jgi:Protein of unknown function (DUF4238)
MRVVAKPTGQKHHYLPVFYLKQWAGRDGRLCEFSRPYKEVKPRLTHPDGTGFIRGLYTFYDVAPAIQDFLEQQFFLKADDRAHVTLQLLLTDQLHFDAPTRSAWCRFLMTLIHRNPEGIERTRRQVIEGLPEALEILRKDYDSMRHQADPNTFGEFVASLTNRDIETSTLMVLNKIMNSELIGTILGRMRWGVIRINHSRYPLLTSDRPLILSDGLRAPHGHLLMPISPDKVFVAYQSDKTLDLIKAMSQQRNFVESLNDRIVRQARRFVYGTDDRQLRFVANRLGEKMQWSPWE